MSAAFARREDERLLRGEGKFVANMRLPDEVYAYVLRSPYAHARIRSINVATATTAANVLAIYTGHELKAGTLNCQYPVTSTDGSAMNEPARPVLATDTVRFVGDPVAMVVATSLLFAEDAAELIDIDYEPLPVSVDLRAAEDVCFDWETGDAEAVAKAFSKASQIFQIEAINNRIIVNPLEPRAAIGDYDAERDRLTLYTQSQGVHLLQRVLADEVFNLPREKLRVVTPDVGGSFGMKIAIYPEHALVLYAARALRRPVKWVSDRSEAFQADTHGRDHVARCEVALDEKDRFLAMQASVRANLGAYLSTFGPLIPTTAMCKVFGHVYDVPALHVRVQGMLTNTSPLDAYRGAGKPEIHYLVERLVEKTARSLNYDPIAFRRQNLVPTNKMPYTSALGFTWDRCDFAAVMDHALDLADWSTFAERRHESEAKGRRRGIGIGLCLHTTGGSGDEVSQVVLLEDGTVQVRTGTQSSGQSHESAFAHLVSNALQIPMDRVSVVQGDTSVLERGGGTGGSSSLPIAGCNITRATEDMLDKARIAAAELLEAASADLSYGNGTFRVPGTDLSVSLYDVATHTNQQPGGCVGEAEFDAESLTCPNSAYVCEVEVDSETGRIELAAVTAVDDLGVVLNPQIAEGQVVGGLTQGIGQALLEHGVYDTKSGQLLTGSFMDYAMLRADDLPNFVCAQVGEPTRNNRLGTKGAGEVGSIGGSAALVNAVCDALGDDRIDMPTTPCNVWQCGLLKA